MKSSDPLHHQCVDHQHQINQRVTVGGKKIKGKKYGGPLKDYS